MRVRSHQQPSTVLLQLVQRLQLRATPIILEQPPRLAALAFTSVIQITDPEACFSLPVHSGSSQALQPIQRGMAESMVSGRQRHATQSSPAVMYRHGTRDAVRVYWKEAALINLLHRCHISLKAIDVDRIVEVRSASSQAHKPVHHTLTIA
jgi:hypothetical protein